VPIIDLPNYSEYMLNENIEYDEHDLLLDGLFNYNPVNYKKHIINYDHIHDYDSCYNLYFHTETGLVLEYIDNHFKVFGKCDGCHNYIEHEHNSNSRINKLNYNDMILAYKYHLLSDMQYFIIDKKFRLDVIQIEPNMYLDLFSGYIFTLCDLTKLGSPKLTTPRIIFKIDENNNFQHLELEDYFDTGEYGFKIDKTIYSLCKSKLNINDTKI
jgi:hypothetical protein